MLYFSRRWATARVAGDDGASQDYSETEDVATNDAPRTPWRAPTLQPPQRRGRPRVALVRTTNLSMELLVDYYGTGTGLMEPTA
jgi:hypothetical protein